MLIRPLFCRSFNPLEGFVQNACRTTDIKPYETFTSIPV